MSEQTQAEQKQTSPVTSRASHFAHVVYSGFKAAPGLSMLTDEALWATAAIAVRAINDAIPEQGVVLEKQSE